jgi:hypothetical protein
MVYPPTPGRRFNFNLESVLLGLQLVLTPIKLQ